MDTRASTEPANDLRELDDPQFFAHWAKVRGRLAVTPPDKPSHAEFKRCYGAVAAEYRRRVAPPESAS